MKRIGAWLCAAVMLLGSSVVAAAAELIDLDRQCELTVEYKYSDTELSGVGFGVYYVAEVSGQGVYTLRGEFSNYPVQINGLDSEGMRGAASTLNAYAAKDQIKPDLQKTTDETGRFTCGGLTPGLYLLAGERHTQGGFEYVCEPTLVYLPGVDAASGALTYTVTAAPKAEQKPTSPETITRRVLKAWTDRVDPDRPKSVTVHLLRDGEVFKTVELNAENNWRAIFTGLDGSGEWSVTEDVPEGYTVTITQEGVTFLISNTKSDDPDNPDEPDKPDKPDKPDQPDDPDRPGTPDDPDQPDQPGTPDDPDQPGSPNDPDPVMPGEEEPGMPGLPQTGQLWWPVPLLAAGGMMLFLLGYVMRRRGDRDEAQ